MFTARQGRRGCCWLQVDGEGHPAGLGPAHRSHAQPAVEERPGTGQRKAGVWSTPKAWGHSGRTHASLDTQVQQLSRDTSSPSCQPGTGSQLGVTPGRRGLSQPAAGCLPPLRLQLTSAPGAEASCRPSVALALPSCLLSAPVTWLAKPSDPACWAPAPPTLPRALQHALGCPGLASGKWGWFAFEAEEEPALGVDSAVRGPWAGLANRAVAPTGQTALPWPACGRPQLELHQEELSGVSPFKRPGV